MVDDLKGEFGTHLPPQIRTDGNGRRAVSYTGDRAYIIFE
jgi:hypothetical protein